MKHSLLAATALSSTVLFLVPGIALAQSTYDWSGFYAGLGIGGAHSYSTLQFQYNGSSVTLPTDLLHFTGGGSTVGVDVGHNWQAGSLVFGLEGDANLLTFHGSLSGPDYSAEEQIHALMSLRGRLGYTFDRFMIYGTAGIGAGHASFTTDVGKGDSTGASGLVVGPVVGAGIEYALTDKFSVRASGKFYDLSPLTAVGDTGKGDGPDPYTATYRPRPMLFELGFNVHF